MRIDENTLKAPITFRAHESYINDIKFSPDGQPIFSAGMDNVIKLWPVPDWACKGMLSGNEKSVNAQNLTSDGTRLITASSDKTIRVWEMEARSKRRQLDVNGNHALLSPDDRCLAVVINPQVNSVCAGNRIRETSTLVLRRLFIFVNDGI